MTLGYIQGIKIYTNEVQEEIGVCDYYEYRRGISTLVVLVHYSRGENEVCQNLVNVENQGIIIGCYQIVVFCECFSH